MRAFQRTTCITRTNSEYFEKGELKEGTNFGALFVEMKEET